MKRSLVLFIICLIVLLSVWPSAAEPGTFAPTASLFRLGVGARTFGMGRASVGLADDGNAVLSNPAGVTRIEEPEVTSFYGSQLGLLDYGSVTVSGPNYGLSYLQLSSGELEKRDLYGNKVGEFSYGAKGLVGVYAGSIDAFSLGLQSKLFLPGSRSGTPGISLTPGVIYKLGKFQIGLVLKNLLSTKIGYGDHREDWCKDTVVGLAYTGKRFNVDLDFKSGLGRSNENANAVRLGAELKLLENLTIRAGTNGKCRKSIGLSLKVEGFLVSYALSLHEKLGSSQRFSLVTRF